MGRSWRALQSRHERTARAAAVTGAVLALALFAQGLAWGRLAQEVNPGPPTTSWRHVRTPVGELLTDADPEAAQRAAARLQRFAQVLRAAAPVEPMDTQGALVLAIADDGLFASLRPGRGGRAFEVDGFVQGGAARTMVAVNLGARRPDPLETLDHEYVHLALNGALPAQPLWIAEGLAEVFSAWREDEGGALVGVTRPEHVRLLRERGLLPLERLLAAGYTTPEFLDPESRPVLYAQSWALTRLLLDGGSPAARDRLLAFLNALARGTDAPAAFAGAFGYDLGAAQAALLRSLEAEGPPPLPIALPSPTALSNVLPSPPGVAQSVLGELLLRQDRDADARRRFDAALQEDPGLAAPHEALAHLALRRGRWEEARAQLDAALKRQPDDPRALYRMADLIVREAGAGGDAPPPFAEARAVLLLEQALAVSPYFADATLLLAQLRPQPRGLRIRMVEDALARNPGRTDLAFTLAGLRMDAQDPQGAAAALIRARDSARDDTERFLSEHLLRRLGDATAGTVEARGRLTHLECRPGGALDFIVEADPGSITGGVDLVLRGAPRRATPAGPRLLRLRATSPAAVLLQDGSGELLQRELICGPQQGAVRVRYRLLTDSPPGPPLDGLLLTLRFLGGP